ncbi:MAG TPA: hypothetical protein VGM77_05415 [Gemmatimonadales bacterium]|jgi:hypothetical protein
MQRSTAPIVTLLSQCVVAYTVEFDNTFEERVPHRTSDHGAPPGVPDAPWLVSRVMWQMLLRHVPPDGVSIAALKQQSGLSEKSFRIWLTRLSEWWGYLIVTTDAAVPGGKWVQPTRSSEFAMATWPTLDGEIEMRWGVRLGVASVSRLRDALVAIDAELDPALPEYLPILGYGLSTAAAVHESVHGLAATTAPNELPSLARLLNRVLLALALEFERATALPLALVANVLRVLGQDGVRVRDLPALTGVSKPSIEIALKLLRRTRGAALAADPDGKRVRAVRITERGALGQERYRQGLVDVEKDWCSRYGAVRVAELKRALAELVGDGTASGSPLFAGLVPPAGSWRAAAIAPVTLPHFPVILHRGGFPDGS